jgi:HNH endonuclease
MKLTKWQKIFLKHVKSYYDTSLKYFGNQYLWMFLKEGDLIPEHVAYLCPLCIKNLIWVVKIEDPNSKDKGLLYKTSEFTLDHFPPESVGGKQTVWVCKECNNKAGDSYDHQIKKHIEHLGLQKKGHSTKVPVQSKIEDVGNFKGYLESTENQKWLLHLKTDEAKVIKPLDEWISDEGKGYDWQVDVTIPTPVNEGVQKAMLKSAYLYCFTYFGYQFVFSKAGELIRQVLKGETEYPVNPIPLQFDKESQKVYNDIAIGVCYISQPENLKSIVVNLKLINKENGYEVIHPVFIPDPTETSIEDLKRITKFIEENININISITPLNKILDETPNAYHQTWHDILNAKPVTNIL